MPSKSVLTASLTPELTTFIGALVSSGRYRSASEVVRAGLRALERDERQGSETSRSRVFETRFLDGTGQIGRQIAEHDWGRTPLGSIATWPQSLRTAVSVVLNSKFPTYMVWGPELTSFYNDAYRPILGSKPEALGRPFRDVWAEAWSTVGPIAERAMAGDASFFENLPITVERNGYPEETWWSFSYSPIRDEAGGVGGVLCTVYETTAEVQARSALEWEKRRLEALFQQAPGIMATLTGPDHVFELANSSYLKLVGNRDLIGRPVRQAFPEIEGQGFFELLDEVYASGKPHAGRQVPIDLQRVAGGPSERRYIDFVYQPIIDERDAVTGIFVEGHDVTAAKLAEMALHETNERFRLFSSETREGVVIHDGERVLDCNPACAEMFGFESAEEAIGAKVHDHVARRDLEALWKLPKLGDPAPYEVQARRRDGTMFPAQFAGRDAEWHGQKVRVAVIRDLTEENRRAEALRASESQLRLALDAGRMAVWRSDGATSAVTTTPELNRLLGFAPDAAPTVEEIRSRYAPGARERLRAVAVAALARGERYAEEELEVIWADGSHHWLLLRAELEAMADGEDGPMVNATGVALDITNRKRWEEHQGLLINELNHRVKNTLTTVQSIARQTLRATATDLGPVDAFEARLLALSRAHDVLTRENWEGAELREIIDEVLEPYGRDAAKNFEITGPHLRLSPKTALSLAMALHELATNAAKYGALSVPTGRVAIDWSTTGNDPVVLLLQWREQGGPPVVPPTAKGFGTRLISRMLAEDLGGEVHLTYPPTGVACTIEAPLPDQGSTPAAWEGRAVA